MTHCRTRFFVAAIVCLAATPLFGAPTITNLSVRGLNIGQPTTIVIDGADLLPDPLLVLPVKIAAQSVKPNATANHVELDVTLDASAAPGIYLLRIASGKGISSPLAVGIDKLPQIQFAPQIATLPVAMHGSLGGPQVLKTTFTGTKGTNIVIDCEAQRLGSNLKPVVRLYNERGTQLAWSAPKNSIGGDARCAFTLPADGAYAVEVHDQLYRAGMPAFFRLKVGSLQFADIAFPLAVSPASKTPIRFAASNLTATSELDSVASVYPGERASTLPAADQFTGAAPRIIVSDHPEHVETPPAAGQIQGLGAAPVGVSGTIAVPAEEDKYLLDVTPGQNLRFTVTSHRMGTPLDGVLSIRNEQGAQLAANDDQPNTSDPGLDFAVPAGVTKLQLVLADMQKKGGAEFVYRIEVTDLGRPDFDLSIDAASLIIPSGATQVIPVEIERRNYGGAIELSVSGLPAEVKIEGTKVAPGASIAILSFTAPAGFKASGVVRVVGKATESPVPLVRVARTEDVAGGKYQPQFLDEVGLSVSEPAPFGVAWAPTSEDKLPIGSKLAAKLQFTRAAGVAGNIRIKLVSTQPMPQKKAEQPPPARRRRGQSVAVPTIPDVDRSIRLEGMPLFAADKAEGVVNILVPGDLPQRPWDVALVAELLGPDNQTVIARVAAPARTLPTSVPFTLELTSAPKIDGKAGAGATGKFVGKLNRLGGFNQPVTVTLANLPKEYPAPKVVVPGDKTDFELAVVFPFGAKPMELKDGRLVGLIDPAKPDTIRSNEVAVVINVVPGEKPASEPPKEIFEDDEKFVALLNEGGGTAAIEPADKASGKASIKVTPDQKFNANLPGLQAKIRENPAPGEFRYIRFAWKKKGGAAICLQLNHDGAWGPGGSGKEGAKFRYHSGPAEVYGGSLAVGDKLPEGFVVVTRDLFADFGEFTLNGIALSPVDGEFALFDQLYLGKNMADFDLIKPVP
ncbi:MAG: hypothetical protein ACKVP0_24935 [Pirellulaceae bacterium]